MAAPVPQAAPVDDHRPAGELRAGRRRRPLGRDEDDASSAPGPPRDGSIPRHEGGGLRLDAPGRLPPGWRKPRRDQVPRPSWSLSRSSPRRLASAGTYGCSARPARSTSPLPRPAAVGETVTRHSLRRRAVGDHVAAANVSPAIVTITSRERRRPNDPFGQVPTTGIGLGSDLRFERLDLTTSMSSRAAPSWSRAPGRRSSRHDYGIDTLTDLAIVKVEATACRPRRSGTVSRRGGQLAIASAPAGTYHELGDRGTSPLRRTIQVQDGTQINNLIQTDAASTRATRAARFSTPRLSRRHQHRRRQRRGIGFAIPINIAKPDYGAGPRRPEAAASWIGIRYQALSCRSRPGEAPVSTGACSLRPRPEAPRARGGPDSPRRRPA